MAKILNLFLLCGALFAATQAQINSCRWCANSCGGDFPVDGGHLSADQNWPDWQYSFKTGCSGPYGHHEINSGVHLCCQVEDINKRGQCRICSSCGGDFPEIVGAVQVDQDWDGFTYSYDHDCSGFTRVRNNPGDGLKMCCQIDPICSLCSSCGGEWPHETGVLAADQNWPDWFQGRGHRCSGEVGKNDARGGMKWCCKTKSNSEWLLDI